MGDRAMEERGAAGPVILLVVRARIAVALAILVGEVAVHDRAAPGRKVPTGAVHIGILQIVGVCGCAGAGAAAAEAAGPDHEEDGKERGDAGYHGGRRSRRGVAEEEGGYAEEEIAGDAAEPGRQRPRPHHRQRGESKGSEEGGADPGREGEPAEGRGAAEDEAPGPDDGGQEQGDRGQAEKLHDDVGDHRARQAERIARLVVGGVAQARVVDRPGGKARGDRGRQGEQPEARQRAEVSPEQPSHGAVAAGCHERHRPRRSH